MPEDEKQESQKTVVAFIAGLLIGGLLVWVFGGTPETNDQTAKDTGTDASEVTTPDDSDTDDSEPVTTNTPETTTPAPIAELPIGDGSVRVADQSAGMSVSLDGATFPSDEGWIGVRGYVDGQLTNLLGVARYSKEQGLVPEEIVLLTPTVAGNSYAVVFYSESGDRVFNLAEDVQVGGVMDTFTAK